MIQTIVLEEVKNENKISKNNKPYVACSIKVAGVWHSGFGNKITQGWQGGQSVMVDLYEETFNGKQYKKFKPVTQSDLMEERLVKLEQRMDACSRAIKAMQTPDNISKTPW